jgi:carbon-monoxide dehydrogenase medium subunit
MNAGLVEPGSLVALRHIEALRAVRRLEDGTVELGAMRRHRETAEETDLPGGQSVLRHAARQIANPTVRNMGTLGGSIALDDPGADYPAALVAADATVLLAGPGGERAIPAADFFVDWYTTALEPGEIILGVRLPPGAAGGTGHYEKLARISGDFAMASIALQIAWQDDAIAFIRVAVGGCGPRPIRLASAEALLTGSRGDAAAVARAGALLAEASDPVDDVRASADYRRRVIPRLLARAIDATRRLREAA